MSFPITTGDLVTAADLNSLTRLDIAEVVSGTSATLQLSVPAGLTTIRVVGRARSSAAVARANLQMRFNGETGNIYRWHNINLLDTTVSGSFTNAGGFFFPGDVAGANAGTGLFGSVDVTISGAQSGRPNYLYQCSVGATTAGSDARTVSGGGQVTSAISPVSTVDFALSSGSFVVGTRFELWPG